MRLQSRALRDITGSFPEMGSLPKSLSSDGTVLDGELVCFDQSERPSFARMQSRLQRQSGGSHDRGPRASFVAFDLLYVEGTSVMDEPLGRRKNLLHQTLRPTDIAQPCEFIETDGQAFFAVTREHELEGIMAKDKSSPYLPGKRSPSWQKIKRLRSCDFVIGGYDFGGGNNELISSLIVGLYDARRRLVYAGHVGSGFSKPAARRLHSELQALHTSKCPFDVPPRIERFVYWCRPERVCRVEYGEFTSQGRLRYAMWIAQTDDKLPTDCRVDDAPGWPAELAIR